MSRPHRPNLATKPTSEERSKGESGTYKSWRSSHPKQETHAEGKARRRSEAEARNALTHPEHRRQARLARLKLINVTVRNLPESVGEVLAAVRDVSAKVKARKTVAA